MRASSPSLPRLTPTMLKWASAEQAPSECESSLHAWGESFRFISCTSESSCKWLIPSSMHSIAMSDCDRGESRGVRAPFSTVATSAVHHGQASHPERVRPAQSRSNHVERPHCMRGTCVQVRIGSRLAMGSRGHQATERYGRCGVVRASEVRLCTARPPDRGRRKLFQMKWFERDAQSCMGEAS